MNLYDLSEKNVDENAALAADILRAGGVIIYPTMTIYGIGAALSQQESLRRINEMKGRPPLQPQILLIDFQWITEYVENCERYMPLLEILWPGPFTILLPAKFQSPFDPPDKIAFRVSEHVFIQQTLKYLGEPLSSTSVNRAGDRPAMNRERIIADFGDDVDGVFYQDRDLKLPFWNHKLMEQKFLNPSTMIDASNFPESVDIIRSGISDLSNLGRHFPDLMIKRSYDKK